MPSPANCITPPLPPPPSPPQNRFGLKLITSALALAYTAATIVFVTQLASSVATMSAIVLEKSNYFILLLVVVGAGSTNSGAVVTTLSLGKTKSARGGSNLHAPTSSSDRLRPSFLARSRLLSFFTPILNNGAICSQLFALPPTTRLERKGRLCIVSALALALEFSAGRTIFEGSDALGNYPAPMIYRDTRE